MPTRRHFLITSGAVTAVATAAPADSAIAKLKSRRSEAQPITVEERRARIQRAQQLMAGQKINSICLAGGTSLDYFAGVRWGNSERLFAMVIPARGEPFFIGPSFEEGRAREQISRGNAGEHAQVFTWHEDVSPYALVASSLKERGLATGRLGIEETVKFVLPGGIGKALPAAPDPGAAPDAAWLRVVRNPTRRA